MQVARERWSRSAVWRLWRPSIGRKQRTGIVGIHVFDVKSAATSRYSLELQKAKEFYCVCGIDKSRALKTRAHHYKWNT
jgi:hypothetical protein